MLGLKKILAAVKGFYLPALILGCAVLYFCGQARFQSGEYQLWQILFYILLSANVVFVMIVREFKPLMHLLWLIAMYLLVNHLRFRYGAETMQMPSLQILLFLLPINWLYFTTREEDAFFSDKNFYFLCLVLIQLALVENADKLFEATNVSFLLQNLLIGEWGIVFLCLLIQASLNNNIKINGLCYAFACLGLAFLNMESPAAMSLFSCAAVLILLVSSVQNFLYTFVYDDLTGVYSRRMYHFHASNSFPLKFSIGVVCLDDYAKLVRVFGQKKVNVLLKIIVDVIRKANTGAIVYRYNDDEFILVFKNEDKKQSYEYLENIRRTVAGAEFVLNRKQIVKITISAGVSEKKRSDADAGVVLERTREVLQKTYKFTQNITSRA